MDIFLIFLGVLVLVSGIVSLMNFGAKAGVSGTLGQDHAPINETSTVFESKARPQDLKTMIALISISAVFGGLLLIFIGLLLMIT